MKKNIQQPCNNFGLLIGNIKNKMRKRMQDRLKPYNLTPEQRMILLLLNEKREMTQIQLCELTSMEPSNLSTTLKRLESKGYIEKVTHPNDPRAYLVQITDQNKNIVLELLDLTATTHANIFNGINENDLRITCETLIKLDKKLKN